MTTEELRTAVKALHRKSVRNVTILSLNAGISIQAIYRFMRRETGDLHANNHDRLVIAVRNFQQEKAS